MADNKSNDLQLLMSNPRRVLPLLAALFTLLALWVGWSGVQQWRETQLADNLQQARDTALAGSEQAFATHTGALANRLASDTVKAALSAGDAKAAARTIGEGWKTVDPVQVLPSTLDAAYANPEAFGFSKLAVLEAALKEGKAVARVVGSGGKRELGVAAPAAGYVVYGNLPLDALTDVFERVDVSDRAYLALRQGGHTVYEKGDTGLSGVAESLARPLGDGGLRVVAALPDGTEAAMGLEAAPSLVAAALFAALAIGLLLLASGRLRVPGLRARNSGAGEEDAPTLGQALQREPLPVPTRAAADKPGDAKPAASNRSIALDPGIFRAYDIRGVVGTTLSVEVAVHIGQAVGTVMEEQGLSDVVVGHDGRLSGPELSAGLIQGLVRAGRNVIDIGVAPTPVAYFAAYHLRTGSCVAVTGSHNPPDYNGFKIVIGGTTLAGEAIGDLYTRISEGRLHQPSVPGDVQQREVASDYIQRIADDVQLDRPLKVVVDAGNGAAGEIAPQLLEAIGAEAISLYCDIDGTFPNHHPDPSEPQNLEDLIQTVKRFDADLGVAFDGDGDRLGVVTKTGEIVYPDRLLMLLAADVLERNPGAMILYDVKCTGKLQPWVLRHGGTPLMAQTGHSLIKAKMRETGAELAGEMSGHFFFQERWYGFDDGLYAAARLLEVLAFRPEAPSEVLSALPSAVSTPEIKVPVPAGNAHDIVQRFIDNADFEGARLSTIDGLRADWEDGWGLVRASNTTPVLVLRFEGDTREALARTTDAFRAHLLSVAPELTLTF
ncbi:MAG TPA: phosphomannomutase/phosphoglucomutase [Pseudoxanthomonas sp.]|nr:phosphomannomutase/phosphoglucomutase [Pseudoxanthomonas sp.]